MFPTFPKKKNWKSITSVFFWLKCMVGCWTPLDEPSNPAAMETGPECEVTAERILQISKRDETSLPLYPPQFTPSRFTLPFVDDDGFHPEPVTQNLPQYTHSTSSCSVLKFPILSFHSISIWNFRKLHFEGQIHGHPIPRRSASWYYVKSVAIPSLRPWIVKSSTSMSL